MSSHASLSAAADDRKARLAQLRSLKRKEPTAADEAPAAPREDHDDDEKNKSQQDEAGAPPTNDVARLHLSGRNYDFETRGPKLGFEAPPTQNMAQPTLEEQARQLEEESRRRAEQEAQDDKGIDLFKLQPKKPNWDLKRELNRKMEVLNVRTENAIARLVRERLAEKKAAASTANAAAAAATTGAGQKGKHESNGDTEADGMLDGAAIVEGMRQREREDAEEARREREAEAEEFAMA